MPERRGPGGSSTPSTDIELVHDLHRQLRVARLRAQTNADRRDPRSSAVRLRRLARLAGRVRDRDVALRLVQKMTVRRPRLAGRRGRRLVRRLQLERRTLRAELEEALKWPSSRRLLDSLTRPATRADWVPSEPARAAAWAALERERIRAFARPSSRRLHRLRKRMRDWSTFEIQAVRSGRSPPALADARAVLRLLGSHHDVAELHRWIERRMGRGTRRRWRDPLERRAERQRQRALDQLGQGRWELAPPPAEPVRRRTARPRSDLSRGSGEIPVPSARASRSSSRPG